MRAELNCKVSFAFGHVVAVYFSIRDSVQNSLWTITKHSLFLSRVFRWFFIPLDRYCNVYQIFDELNPTILRYGCIATRLHTNFNVPIYVRVFLKVFKYHCPPLNLSAIFELISLYELISPLIWSPHDLPSHRVAISPHVSWTSWHLYLCVWVSFHSRLISPIRVSRVHDGRLGCWQGLWKTTANRPGPVKILLGL